MELTDGEKACIYAMQQLQDALKNPHSLEVYSIQYVYAGFDYEVKIEYAANNDYGGKVEDDYCYEINDQIFSDDVEYDEKVMSAKYSSGYIKTYEYNKMNRDETEVDVQKILDNIDMVILEY